MSKYRENMYQADKLAENSQNFKILLLIGGISASIYSIYTLITQVATGPGIAFHVLSSLLLLVSFFMPSFPNFVQYSLAYLIVSYLLMQIFYLISQTAFGFPCLPMCTYLPVLYIIGFSNHWFEMSLSVIFSTIISAIIGIFWFQKFTSSTALLVLDLIEYCTLYLCICLTASLVAYNIDKSKRLEFVLIQKVQVEIQKTKSVLSYLLPSFVTKRVQGGVRYISDYQGVVSVIFCDINNFEGILKDYNAQELTDFLDEVFGKFDQICLLSGCTKIETVGKTYMACAGLKDSEAELDPYYSSVSHARRCVEMGLAIIRNAEKIGLKGGGVLQFNIGINSGLVTAGVVGYHKPQFSLVGDTVNTASRMASLSPRPNTLQISKDTYNLIGDKSGLIFDPHKVEAKGKGQMKTFLVSVPESLPYSKTVPSTVKPLDLIFNIRSGMISTNAGMKPKQPTKKITLLQLNDPYSDGDRKRFSILDELEDEIANDNEFVRKETEVLEDVKWFSVGCKETYKETLFRLETSEATCPIAIYGMTLRLVSDFITIVLLTVGFCKGLLNYSSYNLIIGKVLEIIIASLILARFKKCYKNIWYSWLISSVYLIGAIVRFILSGSNDYQSETIFIAYVFRILQAAHCSQLLFKNFIWAGLLAVIVQIVFSSIYRQENWLLQILANIIFFTILLFTIHTREQKLRYFATLKSAAEKKLQHTEELLIQMMPKHVFEKLKENHSVTEEIHNVTILYADIVGFTGWSSQKSPGEIVNMLSDLFTEFDRKSIEYEVYKVHTIGDCYVAMGYTGSKSRNENVECYKLAKFALALVDIIKEKNEINGTKLNMRIGMHTGKIYGGIAGTNIVRYDIYGIDVYIANKMESCSQPGCIKISEACKNILHSNWPMSFVFNRDNNVNIPINSTTIKTYFLEKNPEEYSAINNTKAYNQ
jgi:class 3 adenylate cyclase